MRAARVQESWSGDAQKWGNDPRCSRRRARSKRLQRAVQIATTPQSTKPCEQYLRAPCARVNQGSWPTSNNNSITEAGRCDAKPSTASALLFIVFLVRKHG